MKKAIVLLLAASALLFLNAGKKQKQEVPPGTVCVNDTLYADATEISNLSWLEYVEYNKRKYGANSKEYIMSLPDTLVWREKNSNNEPYVQYYFRHVAYHNYPVVGISYEQARAFCVWRSERVNYFINIREGKQINHPDSVFRGKLVYEYRLPTKQEWEALAIVGNDKKLETAALKKSKYLSNNPVPEGEKWNDNNDVTVPVNAYIPNKLGLYNLKGNVAEMVQEKGIAKGGGWRDLREKCFLLNNFAYEKPTAMLGFRCVCVKRN